MYIHHTTLNTGRWRNVLRSEVSDDAIAYGCDLIAAGGGTLAGPAEGYTASIVAHGKNLVATISCGEEPIATIGVARKSRTAPRLWRELAEISGVSAAVIPLAPWCAAWLHPALAAHLDATLWLGDLERIIAWSWLVGRGQPIQGDRDD